MTDLRQSPQYGEYIASLGWRAERISDCQILVKRLPLIGSLIKIQRPDKIPFEKIDELAKKHRALFVKLEPKQSLNEMAREQLEGHGYCHDSWPLLATKTIQLDLKKSLGQLQKEMAKKTRYCLRKVEQAKSKLNFTDNLGKFYENFRKFGKGYIPKKREFQVLVKAFGQNAILLSVKDLAGALVLIHDGIAYYYFAFTSPEGRKIFAQHFLVWEAIKRSKKLGCRIFDFEGIEDSRYKATRKWQGFTHFKKSFGGEEIEFPGSFIKIYHPILKLLPRIA